MRRARRAALVAAGYALGGVFRLRRDHATVATAVTAKAAETATQSHHVSTSAPGRTVNVYVTETLFPA